METIGHLQETSSYLKKSFGDSPCRKILDLRQLTHTNLSLTFVHKCIQLFKDLLRICAHAGTGILMHIIK